MSGRLNDMRLNHQSFDESVPESSSAYFFHRMIALLRERVS